METGFKAIIFDLDGVIINSEDLHARAKKITLEHYKVQYPENIFTEFKGRPDLVFWQYVSSRLAGHRHTAFEMDKFKRKIFFGFSNEIMIVPGIADFLPVARKLFTQTALVTSATYADVMISEEKFGFLKWFDVIELGDHSLNHKPHPEPYLNALKKLDIAAGSAVVIEDSPNGVISAKTAGCYVIGITTGFTQNELLTAGADQVFANFSEIAAETVRVQPQ